MGVCGMKRFGLIKRLLGALFQKRSVIVISSRGTNHMDLSGRRQFLVLCTLVGLVGWASFYTGKYMTAQGVVESQGETIESMTTSRVQKSFSFIPPSLSPSGAERIGPVASDPIGPMLEGSVALSAMDENKLLARIAYLEARERELLKYNERVIVSVREKAHGQIQGLEEVLRTAGLDAVAMQREASKGRIKPEDIKAQDEQANLSLAGQGGPFIPTRGELQNSLKLFDKDLALSVDRIATLNGIIHAMPLVSPLGQSSFESGFGSRTDPFTGRMAFHAGIDLAGPAGSEVLATNGGKVTFAGHRGAYGNMVEIEHKNGFSTRYAHLAAVRVREDQLVNKGDVVGIQGSTGRSTGAHVHYEVRVNDRPMNPAKFLAAGRLYVSKNAE